MGKTTAIAVYLLLTVVSATVATSGGADQQSLCYGRRKYAKFHVYIQDIYGTEPNATVWLVAEGRWTNKTDTYFGQIRVIDCLMTAGTAYNSPEVGRIQGMVAFSDFNVISVTMNMNFYFTRGPFRGSSLICLGRNPMSQLYNRDLPIVGGTGAFLNARGYTISNTLYNNPEKTYHILEYFIYVEYYDGLFDCLQRNAENTPWTEIV